MLEELQGNEHTRWDIITTLKGILDQVIPFLVRDKSSLTVNYESIFKNYPYL